MNKKGMLPRTWIGIVVIIGMLFAATSFWIGEWQGKYSPIENSNLSESYNKISDMASVSGEMQEKLKSETQPQTIGWLDFIVTGGYQVLMAVLSVPSILIGFAEDAGAQFGIPRIYINGLIVLISVGAIFGVIGAIFRRKT